MDTAARERCEHGSGPEATMREQLQLRQNYKGAVLHAACCLRYRYLGKNGENMKE